MKTLDFLENTLKKGVLYNKEYTLNPIDCKIKLNQNESPFDLPDLIKTQILDTMNKKNWNIYPDFIPMDLYKKISGFYGLTHNNIMIGNGSNEMIFTLLCSTLESGKKIVISNPTFTVYNLIASNLNADIKHIMLNPDFTYKVDEIIDEAKAPGSLIIICSPNNPTGTYLERDNIIKILEESNGIVVLDEAYIHFGGETVIDLINEYPGLIVLRTFSKAFGLAGLRIGMLFAHEEVIKQLMKVKLPYNLNIFTLATLDAVFDKMDLIEKNMDIIKQGIEFLAKELGEIKELNVTPTSTNFFLVKTPDSKWLFNRLLEYDILVRDVSSYPMLDNCLRISVGNENNNKALIKALREIY